MKIIRHKNKKKLYNIIFTIRILTSICMTPDSVVLFNLMCVKCIILCNLYIFCAFSVSGIFWWVYWKAVKTRLAKVIEKIRVGTTNNKPRKVHTVLAFFCIKSKMKCSWPQGHSSSTICQTDCIFLGQVPVRLMEEQGPISRRFNKRPALTWTSTLSPQSHKALLLTCPTNCGRKNCVSDM